MDKEIIEKTKEALNRKGVRIIDIARMFNCTPSNIQQLFTHKAIKSGNPSAIRKYICNTIKADMSIWE